MERMSDRELKMLRELQAKQKRVQRADAEFFKAVDSRRNEVLEHLHVTDEKLLSHAAELYGTDTDTLYVWICDQEQIRYFQQSWNGKRSAEGDNDEEGIVDDEESFEAE